MIMSQSDEVQTKVLNSLYWDLAAPPHGVKVEVENGWVTISGTVDRCYQRTCAESDAQGCWRAWRQQSYSACVGERGARGHRPLAIDVVPPARALLPRMAGNVSGVAVVVNLISTALRGQSARRQRVL